MKTEVFLIILISIPNMVPNKPVPMDMLSMIVISMSSLSKKEKLEMMFF